MRLSFDPIAPVNDPLEPIATTATITNDTDTPATFWASATASIYRGDIHVSPYVSFSEYTPYNPTEITIKPGETWQAKVQMELNLFTFLGQTGRITEPFKVRMALPIPTEGEDHPGHYDGVGYHLETDIELRVDLTGYDWLRQPNGDVAHFFRKDGVVFHRTDDRLLPKAVDTKNHSGAMALTRRIIDDGRALYIFGHVKKRRPKGELIGLNAVFYRSTDTIFTEYGNAKVDDPATFKVLDNGMHGQSHQIARLQITRNVGVTRLRFCQR